MNEAEGLRELMGLVGYAVEAAGVLAVAIGILVSCTVFLRNLRRTEFALAYGQFRSALGRTILLGLEFLIAGDIIRTVVVTQTLTSVAVLAVIVLIRTFLSLTITMELDGRWPWQGGRPAL